MIELVLRIGFSLLVVFGLMWGLAKLARRPLSGHRGTGTLAVLNRQQLSRGSSVAVVRVADRALILGVTDNQVSLLGETDPEPFEKHPHPERRDHLLFPANVDPASPSPQHGGGTAVAAPIEPAQGRLTGSVLSPRTWTAALDFLRDRTSRR
ncbi:MAG TPA: flagellar biosynthetic protein FliO [Actinoplanes sp.]